MSDLKKKFIQFASHGAGGKEVMDMDGKNFSKCCKDSGLFDKVFTPTDADLIFAKVKQKTARRINYNEFVAAVEHIAAKKKLSVDQVKETICGSSAKNNATVADAVKFHDDKSLYTGVYAQGGPTNVDSDKVASLAGHLDRSDADVRGVKKV